MGLVSSYDLLRLAKQKKVAIAAFNIHNLETLQGVLRGASQMRSPVIIQTTPGTLKYAGIDYITALVKAGAEAYDIPVVLHMDHCQSYDELVRCIQKGYTSVMVDGAHLNYQDNVALVKEVTKMAHAAGVQVEGEIGQIHGVEEALFVADTGGGLTLPKEAAAFVKATGVDSLAVAIGNGHGLYKGPVKLDFERLDQINKRMDLPLVLHGASGLSPQEVKKTIAYGMTKVNIATDLKGPMAMAIRQVLCNDFDENDPRVYMGQAREAVEAVVIEKIKVCQSWRL